MHRAIFPKWKAGSVMMSVFFLSTSGGTHELLPCGLEWRKLVKLFKKRKSTFYWYDFTVRGERFRGSTKEANATRAAKIAGLKLAQATEGSDPLPRRAPTLGEFARDFLKWVDEARREEKTKIYYRDGWRLLCRTRLAGMRLDQITRDVTDRITFPGSPANRNCALRTLRRMLHMAEEKKLVRKAPKVKLAVEFERAQRLDEESEKKLLAAAATCGWTSGSLQLFEDVVKLMRDTGMRNRRELYRIRIENIDWQTRSIFVPDSKTPEGRRTVPMSERVFEILRRRCCDSQGVEKKGGWRKGRPAEKACSLLRAPRFWNGDYRTNRQSQGCDESGTSGCQDRDAISTSGSRYRSRSTQSAPGIIWVANRRLRIFTAHFTAHPGT